MSSCTQGPHIGRPLETERVIIAQMRHRYEFTLWVCVMVLGIHFLEEYGLDLRSWMEYVFRVPVTWEQNHMINAAVVIFAVAGAVIGWRMPALSLIVPALLIMNALLFHLGFSILWMRYSPGTVTAVALFVPAGIWAFIGAKRDGVLTRSAIIWAIAGAVFWHLYMLGFLLIGPPR
jgi:hypothetical protein